MVRNEAELTTNLKTYVKIYCAQNKISQAKLSEKMGYTNNMLCQLINNRRTVHVIDLIKFSNFFDMPVDTFFSDSLFAKE